MVIQSVEYRQEAVIRIDGEEMKYYKIKRIFIVEEVKVFLLSELDTCFCHHIMAFEVEETEDQLLCLYSSFARPGVLHMKSKNGKNYIIEKDCPDSQCI